MPVNVPKQLVTRAVVWLVLGLIGGGLAADLWLERDKRSLASHVEQLQARLSAVDKDVAALRARLAAADGERKQLEEQLAAERKLRHGYEEVLSRGQK